MLILSETGQFCEPALDCEALTTRLNVENQHQHIDLRCMSKLIGLF